MNYLYGTPSENGNIGLRVGDTVTYYSGAVTKNIDEIWTDKDTQPYAFMRCTTNAAHLYISAAPFYATEGYINWVNPTTQYAFYYSQGIWEYMQKWTGDTTSYSLNNTFAVWANHDVIKDGEVWLSATLPISVGEIVEYIDGIPVYVPVQPVTRNPAAKLAGFQLGTAIRRMRGK